MPTTPIVAHMPAELKRELEALARRNYTSMAAEVRRAVARHIAAEQKAAA
jgi:hypothetical protein